MPARRLPAQPVQRSSRVRKRAITRSLWPLSGTRTFLSISWSNVKFLFSVISIWIGILSFYLAAWHEVEQIKCKHDPQLSYSNKIRDLFNEMNFKDVWCERCGKSRRGCPKLVTFLANPHLMYKALASYLFLTTELSAVRLWADFQRIWVLLYWSITLS